MKMGRARLLPIVRRPTPPHPFWIPAFAGMTNEGPDWRRDAANGE